MNARKFRFDWSQVPLFGWVETDVLSYFKPTFEAVHILLNSFLVPKPDWADRFSWPGVEKEREVLDGSNPVTWSQVGAWAGFSSWREVDLVLRSNQLFSESREGQRLCKVRNRLLGPYDRVMEEHDLYEPPEGKLSSHTRDRLLRALMDCGHESIMVWDGYSENRHRLNISEALAGIDGPYPLAFYTEDRKVLVATEVDSYFTFLCASNETMQSILVQGPLESVDCSAEPDPFAHLAGGSIKL